MTKPQTDLFHSRRAHANAQQIPGHNTEKERRKPADEGLKRSQVRDLMLTIHHIPLDAYDSVAPSYL